MRQTSAAVALAAVLLIGTTVVVVADTPFEGQFFSGTAAPAGAESPTVTHGLDYFSLLDNARRMTDVWSSAGDAEFMTMSMLYDKINNAMQEGPTWAGAWWTFNSYGTTFGALPFAGDPFLTWLQRSQNYWFDNIGNGTRADVDGTVGPDGALCDDGEPNNCRYKQGDGNETVDDFAIEESLSAVVMQAELLLVSRDTDALAFYRPLFLRTSDWLETRRDIPTNLFLTGAASNLVAPSYGAWLLEDGRRMPAYLTGISVSYIVALNRLIELARMVNDTYEVELYTDRRDRARSALPRLMAPSGDYFLKWLDPDGTRHGLYGAKAHGYIEACANHDAVAFPEVLPRTKDTDPADDELAQRIRIMDALTAVPGLRPYNFTTTQYPGLDDMPHAPTDIWAPGVWVNGGVWPSNEARMVLAYYRTGRFGDAANSMRTLMRWATDFRMDAPLSDFGNAPYQPNELINICADTFGVAAGFLRGLFGYNYTAHSLLLTPQLPASVSSIVQHFPVRFGSFRLWLSANGTCGWPVANITAVEVNGEDWDLFSAGRIDLPIDKLPTDSVDVTIAIGLNGAPPLAPNLFRFDERDDAPLRRQARRPSDLAAEGGDASTATAIARPMVPGSVLVGLGVNPSPTATVTEADAAHAFVTNCTLNADLSARQANKTLFSGRMSGAGLTSRWEFAHTRSFLSWLETLLDRCERLANGTITPLPNFFRAVAANKLYYASAVAVDDGLDRVLDSYAHSSDPTEQEIYLFYSDQGDALEADQLEREWQIA